MRSSIQPGTQFLRLIAVLPDLFHGLEVRTEPAVATEDLLVDDRRHRQTVEAVRERLPQLDVVPSFAWTRKLFLGLILQVEFL